MGDWWDSGEYDGTVCKHCLRERVMVCRAPNGIDRRVCEKCGWDQLADRYAVELTFDPTPNQQGGDHG